MLDRGAFRTEDGSEPLVNVRLTRGSDIVPKAVDWVWPGYIARGKMTLEGGAPGTGKTTIALSLASILTRGGRWPDGAPAIAGNVIVWSGEDDIDDTLIPRLLAMGANTNRVFFVDGVEDRGESRAFDPSKDVPGLRLAIVKAGGADLILIDPIVSAVSGDSHKNSETRRGLQPLVELAMESRAALLGITHFSKGTHGRDPLERITGSIAFGALPRVVLVAAKEAQPPEGEPARRILARAKANNGPDDGGFYYQLRQVLLPDALIEASIVEWGEAIEGNARSILAAAEGDEEGGGGAQMREAEDFLQDVLSVGPVLAKEILRQAKEAGIAERTLKRAKADMGILSRRSVESGASAHWTWELPDRAKGAKDAKKYGCRDVGTLAPKPLEMAEEPL